MVPHAHGTYREELERQPDPDADVHEQTVSHLQAARIPKELSRLPVLEQLVLRWRFGIAGAPVLSRREIAKQLGRSLREMRCLEKRAALAPARPVRAPRRSGLMRPVLCPGALDDTDRLWRRHTLDVLEPAPPMRVLGLQLERGAGRWWRDAWGDPR